MRQMVALLKHTRTIDARDYSQMPLLERIVEKYLKRPMDFLLKPLLGFYVRSWVGSTSGEVMSSAASYLEAEMGEKENPLSYTRNSLAFSLTYGLGATALISLLGVHVPRLLEFPQQLAHTIAIVNPVLYAGDLVRRLWLYSQGTPSGTIYFETGWWLRSQVRQRIVEPVRAFYRSAVQPMVTRVQDAVAAGSTVPAALYRELVSPHATPDDQD